MRMSSRPRCVVVGAGLAGAATAWRLTREVPGADVVILEQEADPATHATSQNAAMVRALVFEPDFDELSLEGARFWNALPTELCRPGAFRRTGSLLLASDPATLARLEARVEAARRAGLDARMLDARACRARLAELEDTPFEAAAFTSEDGVADPVGLVDAMLAAATRRGAKLMTAARARRLLLRSGRVVGVELADGSSLPAEYVVVAAGAWTGGLLAAAGAETQGLTPLRRHLLGTAPTSRLRPDQPYVWHLDANCYYRPEAGGALFSVCDEEPWPAERPPVDPEIEHRAAVRLAGAFPFLCELPIRTRWAGLRTFTEQRRPLLGVDPKRPGLVRAAGLGGHGVTCAAPAAARVIRSILDDLTP